MPQFDRRRMLQWAQQFPYAALLDSCNIPDRIGRYDWLLATGTVGFTATANEWDHATDWLMQHCETWRFGVLGYDLRHAFENLPDKNAPLLALPDFHFFVADTVIASEMGEVQVLRGASSVWQEVQRTEWPTTQPPDLHFTSLTDRACYSRGFTEIQRQLQAGNIYEINYCRPFLAHCDELRAEHTQSWYHRLVEHNPAVQSVYYRAGEQIIVSSSPERFLRKRGNTLISEPIKGTAARQRDPQLDEQERQFLYNSEKERSENVMIVDLVRNDLSRVAVPGSVRVEELFSIRTLPHVHQMVSVICAELEKGVELEPILRATFPMGSMTGAPKIAAMRIADELEDFRRGWYSGSVGYIDPQGDFDFNVLIRSLFIHLRQARVALAAGGAITVNSKEEDEFQETELKANSVFNAIGAVSLR